MPKRTIKQDVTEDPRYHDTWRLLKRYRDVVWSMELSVQQMKNQFQIEYGCSIEDFLDSVYLAGADLSGTDLEDHARCIERSNKMLTLVNNSIELLRTRHKHGEDYGRADSLQYVPCGSVCGTKGGLFQDPNHRRRTLVYAACPGHC